ncbi:MAG: hypothetical protein ACKODT_07200 [Fluviibacter sp.]
MNENVNLPLDLAELLHVTLGPLADVLAEEGHRWAPMVKRVLSEYTELRDMVLTEIYGFDAIAAIDRTTVLACERVYEMVTSDVENVDFGMWASELGGETV